MEPFQNGDCARGAATSELQCVDRCHSCQYGDGVPLYGLGIIFSLVSRIVSTRFSKHHGFEYFLTIQMSFLS